MQSDELTSNPFNALSSAKPALMTRRSFVEKAGAMTALASMSAALSAQEATTRVHSSSTTGSNFLHLLRFPDAVTAYPRLADPMPLTRSGGEWHGRGIVIESRVGVDEVAINVHAPSVPLQYIHVRWNEPVAVAVHVLGDAWERSYGNLGWRNIIPERVMPWYMATYDGHTCHAYGVKTGARSLCFWQLDPDGVSLWLNLSNGGSGVILGQRILAAATVVTRNGASDENITSALRTFCRQMCSQPTRPRQPVYGTLDWYYAYGNSTAKQILNDTDFIAELSTANAVRPFSCIDMGWVDDSPAFPSMPDLANEIRKRKVRPGIWIRPLQAPAHTDPSLLISGLRFGKMNDGTHDLAYDPTIPEAQEKILNKGKQVVGWGFELVKHDFLTYDLLGRWGFEMGAEPTTPGWSFYDQSRTNAEIILELYRNIRAAAGNNTLITGCNTIGHLGQGYFDIQRTGDDNSGRIWERTRRMGINTLAFRLPQHEVFFMQDADCVGISAEIPWEDNRQWLDLLAHSGTTLFVSPGEGSRVPNHAQAIREAFQLAAAGGDGARPVWCLHESTPQTWTTERNPTSDSKTLHYDWCKGTGAFPFPV